MADELGRIVEGPSPLLIALDSNGKLLQDTWRWWRRRASSHDAEQASRFEDFHLDSERAARPTTSRRVDIHVKAFPRPGSADVGKRQFCLQDQQNAACGDLLELGIVLGKQSLFASQ
jgi:hypothetical protein